MAGHVAGVDHDRMRFYIDSDTGFIVQQRGRYSYPTIINTDREEDACSDYSDDCSVYSNEARLERAIQSDDVDLDDFNEEVDVHDAFEMKELLDRLLDVESDDSEFDVDMTMMLDKLSSIADRRQERLALGYRGSAYRGGGGYSGNGGCGYGGGGGPGISSSNYNRGGGGYYGGISGYEYGGLPDFDYGGGRDDGGLSDFDYGSGRGYGYYGGHSDFDYGSDRGYYGAHSDFDYCSDRGYYSGHSDFDYGSRRGGYYGGLSDFDYGSGRGLSDFDYGSGRGYNGGISDYDDYGRGDGPNRYFPEGYYGQRHPRMYRPSYTPRSSPMPEAQAPDMGSWV